MEKILKLLMVLIIFLFKYKIVSFVLCETGVKDYKIISNFSVRNTVLNASQNS